MAKQKKQADPTEIALSAIEAALDLAPEQPGKASAGDAAAAKLPRIEEHGFGAPGAAPEAPAPELNPEEKRGAAKAPAEKRTAPMQAETGLADARAADLALAPPDASRVANDDRRDSTALVQAFSVKPSRKAYVLAGLASLAWAALGYVVLQPRLGGVDGGLAGLGLEQWSLLALGLAGPILLFFLLAALFVRSQELRLVSRAMSNVALRLAEPETAAAGSVVSLSQAIRREVAAMGDGVERAIARAGELETVVRNEISSLERAYSDNDARLRNLIQELVTQREEIASSSERVRGAINGAHEAITRDLDSASRTLAETVGGAGERVVTAINTAHTTITQDLDNAGRALSETIGSAGERVVTALGERSGEITTSLSQAGDRMVDQITLRGNDLVERLQITTTEVSDKLAAASSHVTGALDEKASDIIVRLEQTGATLTEGLGNGAREVTRTIAETGRDVAQAIATRALEVNDTLRQTGDALADTVGRKGEELSLLLTTQNAALNQVINTDGRALADEIANHANTVHAKLIEAGELSRAAVETVGRNLATTLLDQTETMRTALTEQTDASRQIMTTTARDVVGLLATQSARINEALAGNTETLLTRIDERRTEFETRFTASMGALETLFDRQSAVIEKGMDARTASFVHLFGERASQIETSLAARFGDFERLVLTDAGTLVERLSGDANMLVDRLAGDAERLTRTVEEQLARTERVIGQDGAALLGQIEARTREITETMSQRAGEASEILSSSVRDAAGAMETHIKVFEERSMAKSAEIAGSLDGLIARIDANLGTRASALNDALVERTIDIARVLAEGGRDVTQALSAKADEIGMIVSSKSETLTRTLSDKAEEINATLGGRALEIADTLDQRVARFEERVVNRLDTVSSTLDERGHEIAETLRDQMERVSQLLSQRGEELKHLFTTEGESMVAAMTATNDLLKDEMGGMLARLAQANQLMQQIVASANTNLGAVESGLTKSVADLAAVLQGLSDETGEVTDKVAAQVETIRAVASQTFAGAESLSDKLEAHGRTLAQSSITALETFTRTVSDLDQVERRLEDSLGQRAEQLARAIDIVSRRSEDIENVTRSFASLIEDSLRSAEEKARQIGGVLAESAETTTGALAAQFDAIKQSTAKERERMALALRSAYESVQQDVGGGLSRTAEEFQAAAADLKAMSAAIQDELAATRAELKRGVIDLPRETQEATAAMRRVVSEQIKALNELSDIVAQSGRASDVSEPRLARTTESRRLDVQPSAETRRTELRPSEPRASESRTSDLRLPSTRRPEAQPETARTAPRGGWLSDLLSRASREEEEEAKPAPRPTKTPANRIEKLDSISLDIARMIDHDAAVELWERYQRGERNVFTRRLYTLQGQQAFDEIRRKYRREADFRETVDRYIDEFEKLLADAAADDRDGIVATTYLTSDNGKVYTMLAHASGRFE